MSRQLGLWDPLREIERVQDEVGRLLDLRLSPTVARALPALNAWVNDEAVTITAELPGIDANALDISVVGRTLTLGGSRPAQSL